MEVGHRARELARVRETDLMAEARRLEGNPEGCTAEACSSQDCRAGMRLKAKATDCAWAEDPRSSSGTWTP